MNRQMKLQSSKGASLNTFVDHLIQYRISLWPKTAEKLGLCAGVTDRLTHGPMDGRMGEWTDPHTRDAFMTDASKKRLLIFNVCS